jgi:hypothetical protein
MRPRGPVLYDNSNEKKKSGPRYWMRSFSVNGHLIRAQAAPRTDRLFLQMYSAEADDEMWQSSVRLCLRRDQTPRPLV